MNKKPDSEAKMIGNIFCVLLNMIPILNLGLICFLVGPSGFMEEYTSNYDLKWVLPTFL